MAHAVSHGTDLMGGAMGKLSRLDIASCFLGTCCDGGIAMIGPSVAVCDWGCGCDSPWAFGLREACANDLLNGLNIDGRRARLDMAQRIIMVYTKCIG